MKELRKKLLSAATGSGGRGRATGAAILEIDGILNLFGEFRGILVSGLEEVLVSFVAGNLKSGSSSIGCLVAVDVDLEDEEPSSCSNFFCDKLSLSSCKLISWTEGLRLCDEVDLTGGGGTGPSMWP